MEAHRQSNFIVGAHHMLPPSNQAQRHNRSATPMSSVSYISHRSNDHHDGDHHDGFSGRSTPVHELTDLDDSRSYCSASDMSRSIWEPPIELQRTNVSFSDADSYTLFFPLELTNKDYLRRVLEIAAMGIRTRVMQITSELRLRPIKSESDRDIYYLLKQVIGRNIDWRDEEDRENQEKAIQQMFADRLYCSTEKLQDAARHLYETRNHLFHMERDVGRKFDILKSFEAAHSLLECFGATASHALAQVHTLEIQYDRHHRFRTKRIRQLGWTPPARHSPHLEDVSREELLAAAVKLTEKIEQLLQPAPAAHTMAIARLVGIREDLAHHVHLCEEKRDMKEMQRLERLVTGIDNILSVSKDSVSGLLPQEHVPPEWEIGRGFLRLDNAAAVCHEADELIAVILDSEARMKQHHATTDGGAAAVDFNHDVIDELVRKKEALKTLTIPLSQYHTLPNNATTLSLTGRHIWFARHNDSFTLASIATNNSCLYIVRIVCMDNHWVEPRYYDLCLNYENIPHRVPALRELKRAGFTAAELAASLFLPVHLRAAGYAAKELVQVGCTLRVLKDAGYSVCELNAAGFGLPALRKVGFNANIMREGGYSASDLRSAGFTVSDLKAAWYSATALRHAGCALKDVVAAGYTATETKKAGYSASALRAVGFTASDLRLAGFGVSALRSAGYVPPDLRLAGFTLGDMKAGGFNAVYAKEAGFPKDEILSAGFTRSELEAADLIVAATAAATPDSTATTTTETGISV